MIITLTKHKKGKVPFAALSIGEVFKENNNYYIKSQRSHSAFDAIKLDTGSLSYFHDSYEVETVDCKLIIED